MLRFNEYGLLPPGIHAVNLEEFQSLFGFNQKRKEMIEDGLLPFLRELNKFKVKEIYLDGSFTTQKGNPEDIDGYIITEGATPLCDFIAENAERWHEIYRMDIYAALADFKEGECSKPWWQNYFSQDLSHPGQEKGFVVLKVS